MSLRSYWLDLFTGTTWEEFLNAGANVSGFRESRWATVQQLKPGDYLLCYMTGISRWIGILEVTTEPYIDSTPIWKDNTFPCRVGVHVIEALTPETAVPIDLLRDRLSIFQNMSNPFAWTGRLRGSPTRWKEDDGEAVLAAIQEAKISAISRPFSVKQWGRRPRTLQAKTLGPVTVPEGEETFLPDNTIMPQEALPEATSTPRLSGCYSSSAATWG